MLPLLVSAIDPVFGVLHSAFSTPQPKTFLGRISRGSIKLSALASVHAGQSENRRSAARSHHRPDNMSALVGKEKAWVTCPHWFPQLKQRFCGPMLEIESLWQRGYASGLLAPVVPDMAFAAPFSSHFIKPM